MKHTSRRRRVLVVATGAVVALALAASPAYAHFCSKNGWSEAALAHAAGSQSWLTKSEWLEFVDFAVEEGEICEAGADQLRGQIEAQPADTLFMGPGLLAGGQEFQANERSKGPEHFGYLDFEAAFSLCPSA